MQYIEGLAQKVLIRIFPDYEYFKGPVRAI